MDEREKLRKFRELDDAFAQALRDMEHSNRPSQQTEEQPPVSFEKRLHDLMEEYRLSQENVTALLRTLIDLERIS
ncbi:hypothetical protein GCM10027040_26210 [Halomonas shantousis]